jgi:uronate dehydrogenase
MMTLLLTGGTGRVARWLRPALRGEYRLVLFNRSAVPDLAANETLIRGDLADAAAVERAAHGVDAIVHMGAVTSMLSSWEALLPANILGTYHVFEAARRAGVPRVVYASSHHAVGYYRAGEAIAERVPLRPDSLYGVTKCFGEAMGRLYAERVGLQVVCLRIGAFRERPLEERHLAVWLSPGDMDRLVRCAVEAPAVRFEIVYGISNNTRRWWDLRHAEEVLGYVPRDDAEAYAADVLQEPAAGWLERMRWHGGEKVDLPFAP